jgi:formylglycine-generating enzyme required for sulfatase activity
MAKNLLISFFSLLLLAATAATAQAAKPKLAVFVVGMDDWKRGDVVAHIVGEELNRGKNYEVVTRSGAVQVKLKQLRRTSWYADGCDIRAWGQQHGVEHICLITTPNDRNFSARLFDVNNSELTQHSGGVIGEGMGAVNLKELAWTLTGKLRSSAKTSDVPCMVYVKGGTFTMGFLPGRDDLAANSYNPLPAKEGVEVGDFWICEHEITAKEWFTVKGSYPPSFPNSSYRGANKPVEYVSWNDIKTYLTKLNASMVNTGMVYKLPTEAQWEYAARGGVKMFDSCPPLGCMYSGSNDLEAVAWYEANWEFAGYEYPPDVKTKQPNELGIYGMTGTSWEWCADGWRAGYNDTPSTSQYAVRGGGWRSPAVEQGIVSRFGNPAGIAGMNVGFRVV